MDARPTSPSPLERAAPARRVACWPRRLVFGALTLELLGCSSSGATAQRSERPFEVSVVDTRACPVPPALDPKTTRVVGLKVRITSRHAGNVPANYFYGSVLTKDGTRYLAALPGCTPVLSSRPLEPGESSEGFLNFAVPKDTRLDRVAYAPRLAGSIGSERLEQADLVVEVPLP